MTERAIYAFGDVRVDTGRLTITRAGEIVAVEPKSFAVLVFLIERRDRVVGRDELLDALWRGTFVTPNVLTRAIAQLRKAIGDDAHEARYIETSARRGYRLIADVTVVGDAPGNVPDQVAAIPLDEPALPSVTAPRVPVWMMIAALILVLVAAGASLILTSRAPRSRATDAAPDRTLRRVTTRAGYSGMPTLSPDGRAVAYTSDASGSLELYFTGFAPGSREVALTSDGGQNVEPAWSPDGTWIAYHSRTRRGIWVLPATGGTARQVSDFGSQPGWSPDGNRLVFASDGDAGAAHSVLWTVNRDGADRRALTVVGRPAGGHRSPVWSPDGLLIAFVLSRGLATHEVWIVRHTGDEPRRLIATAGAGIPQFSPDGRVIYWISATTESALRLMRMPITPDGQPAGPEETVRPVESDEVDGFAIAPTGRAVLGLSANDTNLWRLDLDADSRAAAPERLTSDVIRNGHPDYAADGRLAFVQTAIGRPPTSWLSRDDGTGREPLLPDIPAGNPQWDSARQRLLVLYGPLRSGAFAWVDLATRHVTPLGLPHGDIGSPRLSPDGVEIAFHVIDPKGPVNVWTQRLDGSPRRRVTTDGEGVFYPAWSPDGQSLAVQIKRQDETFIGVVPHGGGPVEQLTTDRGQSWVYSWAPDNDRIAYAGQRDGVWNVYAVSRRTRTVTQLTRFTSADGYVRNPAWSPSGRRIVFERAVRSGSVWTLTLP